MSPSSTAYAVLSVALSAGIELLVAMLEMQIMPYEDAANYRFNLFDLTNVWPHKDYPTIPVGRMVLDRNPENFFAQVVQAGFEVANFVRGIRPSPDRMVLGRMFAYGDSNRYRTGANYEQLPVNRPLSEVHNYNKDGQMRYRHNGNQPVYAPNSYRGPKDDNDFIQPGIRRACSSARVER
jgi:catalase